VCMSEIEWICTIITIHISRFEQDSREAMREITFKNLMGKKVRPTPWHDKGLGHHVSVFVTKWFFLQCLHVLSLERRRHSFLMNTELCRHNLELVSLSGCCATMQNKCIRAWMKA